KSLPSAVRPVRMEQEPMLIRFLFVLFVVFGNSFGASAPPSSTRLYVFDCGTLHPADLGRFQLKKEEVAIADMAVACYLIAHPKGTLIWDPGAVPDTAWKPTGGPVRHGVILPDSQARSM